MKKEFVVQAKFDTADFDRDVDRLQRKLKDLYAPGDAVRMNYGTSQRMQGTNIAGAGGGGPSMDAFQKSTQSARRELDQIIVEQTKLQQKLGKELASRAETLKKMQEEQKRMVEGSKEELAVRERIARVEENNNRQKESFKQRDAAINQMLDAKERMKPEGMERLVTAYKNGGVGGVATAGGRMISGMGPAGIAGLVGAAVGGIGAIGGVASDVYRQYGRAGVDTANATGSAVNGVLGRDVNNIYGHRTAFEMAFNPERQKAAAMALNAGRTGKNSDIANLFLDPLKSTGAGIAGGAATGAGLGALLGTVAGPLGTVAGAGTLGTAGAIIGGVGGFGKGIYNMLSDPRKQALALSPFSKTMSNKYNSMVASDMANDYQSSYESQKKANPFKTAAVSDYEQNYMRNLSAQRMMGIGNDQFYGQNGFMKGAINGGFTPELALEMANGIVGSGGSSRSAAGNSGLGLQMQRGMNLTNASNVLGSLSGGIGTDSGTKQATIKILAEGMKLGLDDSKFAEENRRFTQAAADIVSRSGATSEKDFSRVADTFGSYVGDNTNKGIDSAKAAYEQYQQISSTTTGPRGVMRAAGFMKDDKLSQLSTIQKQALMQVPEEELNSSNILVQGAASSLGIDADDLVSRIKGVNKQSVSRFNQSDTIRDRITGRMKEMGMTKLPDDISTLPQDMQKDIGDFSSFTATEQGYSNSRQLKSFVNGQLSPGGVAPSDQAVTDKLAGDQGQMENNTIRAMAADAGTVLKNFNEMSSSMNDAAKTAAAFTDQMREMNAELMSALEASRNGKGNNYDAVSDVLKRMQKINQPNVQNQSGKNSK